MRRALLAALLVSACSSSSSEPAWTAPEQPAAQEEPPHEAPTAPPACRAQLVRRGGVDTETPACADAIARFESLPSSELACAVDSDCLIYMAGSGCLGVTLAAAAIAHTEPLPLECMLPDSTCVTADFSDHHAVCRDGCCAIVER